MHSSVLNTQLIIRVLYSHFVCTACTDVVGNTRDELCIHYITIMQQLLSKKFITHKDLFVAFQLPILHSCGNLRFLANVNANSRSRSLFSVARPSVCRLSSETLVRPTQAVEIFGNIYTALGT